MSTNRRRAIAVAAAMAATAALTAYISPPRALAGDMAMLNLARIIPSNFGEWRLDATAARFVRAADRQGRLASLFDQVLERTFINKDGERIMLSVAYVGRQSSDLGLHDPEACYRAGGFEVSGQRKSALRLGERRIPVKQLFAELPGRPEPVTYWSVVGGLAMSETSTGFLDYLAMAARQRRVDGLLVRLSSIDSDLEAAYRLHAAFAEGLVAALATGDRDRIVGAARTR